MIQWILTLTLVLCSSTSWAIDNESLSEEAQIYKIGFVRDELLQTKYKRVFLDLTDVTRRDALQTWFRAFLKNPEHQGVYTHIFARLSQLIRSEEHRNLIIYYTLTGQNENAIQTLGLYYLSGLTFIENHTRDPFNIHNHASSTYGRDIVDNYSLEDVLSLEQCFRDILQNQTRGFDLQNAKLLTQLERHCGSGYFAYEVSTLLGSLSNDMYYRGPKHVSSFQGFIGRNSVVLHNTVPTTDYAIDFLGQQLSAIHNSTNITLGKKYVDMTIDDFKAVMETEEIAINHLFTRAEGFATKAGHYSLGPVRNGQQGIFQRVIEQIEQAQESVFIDIFWIGGSIGVQLAKTLMAKTVANPDFKVFIISDTENKFTYGPQLNVARNYMRAFSEKFPNKYFYILPANVNLKRTALPEFVDLLFTNSTVNGLKSNAQIDSLLAGDQFNLIGKSDHSKVVITDGKNPDLGVAFVGSKNWTDSSGGIAVDEVAEIRGPAVAVILNHFYYDVLEAFQQENRKSDYVKLHISAKTTSGTGTFQRIQQLIAPIDILQRWARTPLHRLEIPYLPKGHDVFQTAQNNIYGTETSTLDQNIHAILQAREQIIIDDQFLYDPFVVQALKMALQSHNVKLYIMLEPLTTVGSTNPMMAHIPNNLFIPELVALGAQVKWKKVPSYMEKAILDVRAKYNENLAPEFHIKALTVDGVRENEATLCNESQPNLKHHRTLPALITGSANKDVMTMTGGFREYQVLIYGEDAVIRHDCLFWTRWNNPNESTVTNGLDFEVPPEAQQAGLDQESFLSVLRMIFFSTYNFSKDFL